MPEVTQLVSGGLKSKARAVSLHTPCTSVHRYYSQSCSFPNPQGSVRRAAPFASLRVPWGGPSGKNEDNLVIYSKTTAQSEL